MAERIQNKFILTSILDVLLFLLCFTSTIDNIYISVILTVLLIGYIYIGKYSIKISVLDVLIFLLLVLELLSTVFIERCNTFYLSTQYNVTIYYFIVRLTLANNSRLKGFLQAIILLGFFVSVCCIFTFVSFKTKVLFAGFDNIYDFKHLFRPFGDLNNVWGTIVLLFTGICIFSLFISGKKENYFSFICLIACIYCLLTFFSRAIYLSLLLILLICVAFLVASKLNKFIKIAYILAVLLTIVLFVYSNPQAVLRTVKFVETESQQRSIEGRLEFIDYIVPVMKSSTLIGYGTGNYSLATDRFTYEDDNHTFTNFAPNILVQFFVEKGIVGGFLWLAVYFYIFVSFFICRTNFRDYKRAKLLSAILLIAFLRELSFPAMLTNNKILLMFYVFLAFFQNNIGKEPTYVPAKFMNKDVKIISAAIICSFSFFLIVYIINLATEKSYRSYINNMLNKDYFAALTSLEKVPTTTLSSLYYSMTYWQIFMSIKNSEYLSKSLKKIDETIEITPEDVTLYSLKAMILYYLGEEERSLQIIDDLVSKYPENTNFNLILANIQYGSGCRKESVVSFVKAILLNPGILESSEWRNFVEHDKIITDLIIQQVQNQISNLPEEPMLLSKYGKLHCLIGNFDSAKVFLRKASICLPNLETPWVYLAKIAGLQGDSEYQDLLKKLSLWGYNEQRLTTYDNKYERDVWPVMPEFSKYNMKLMSWYKVVGFDNMTNLQFVIK